MTINYTSLLGLAKPVTGTETGQWGDVVNNEITSLLEDAVANAATISVTAGNVTLSTTNGSSNQARMSTLIITGTPGTTRNVVAPSQAKVYVVINQSNAAVVVKGAATTGVTIGAGQTAQIAWNGSDFVEIGNYVHGNFVVNGNLSVNGNSTLGDGGADITTINGQFVGANANISKATTLSTSAPAFFWLEGATYTDTGTAGGTTQPHATFHQIDAPTVNTSNIVTYTNASTLYIAGAPSAAGSATITNPYALFINGGASYFGAAVTMAATTQNLALGTSQTSGTWTAGGAAQTGTLTLDQSTKAHTLNLGTGATENATTKTINIGTAGVSGSTTTMSVGSAVSGAITNLTVNATTTLAPIARSTGAVSYFTVTTPADTGLTASTEVIGSSFSAATRTWATGALTLQRERVFAAPTYAFAGASTLTTAVNVDIGLPVAGTNATITNAYALRAANSLFTGPTIVDVNSASAALRITQVGAGNALLVEDSTNPDATPFVVTATGDVGIGTNSPAYKLQVADNGNFNTTVNVSNTTAGASSYARFLSISDAGNASFGMTSTTYTDVASAADALLINASNASGGMVFAHDGVGKMTLDTSGNLGLGVTPSAWGGNYKGFQVAATGVLASNGSNGTVIGHNSYYDGTNDKYLTSGAASRVFQFNGGIRFDLAPSGFGYGTAATSLTSTQNGNSYTIVTAGTTDFTLIGAANNNVGTTFTKSGGTGAGTGTVSQNISFTQAMTLLANGNLGVGETSPGTRLHASIASATAYTTSSTGNVLTVSNTTASGYAGIAFNTEPSTGNAGLAAINSFAPASGDSVLAFSTRGSATLAERMRLDSSGNLGLGVTPSAWGGGYKGFQVNSTGALVSNGSNATGVGHNYFFDGTNNRYLTTGSANLYLMFNTEHRWYNAPSGTAGDPISFTQAMTLDASGNLLIGTTSARTTLTVAGSISLGATPAGGVAGTAYSIVGNSGSSGNANGGDLTVVAGGGSGSGTNGNLILRAGQTISSGSITTGGNLILESGKPSDSLASGYIAFNVYSGNPSVATERARISSGGYFKASDDGTYINATGSFHEVCQTSSGNYAFRVEHSTATTPLGIQVIYNGAAPNGTGSAFLYCQDNTPATRAEIRSNGGLANYQSNNVDLSDIRTKTDINPLASYWGKIAALEIVTYKYKDQTHDDLNIGVIAQQVEQVAPEFVDADGFGETPEDGVPLKTIYNKDLTFAAIKALQEAMARIEKLEAEVAALKGA